MKVALDVSQTCVEVAGCGWAAHQIARALSAKANPGLGIILYHHFGTWANTDTGKGYFSDSPFVQSPLAELTGQQQCSLLPALFPVQVKRLQEVEDIFSRIE